MGAYLRYKLHQERIMREGRGGGKEREAPTHSIKNLELTHAAHVTKNRQNHKISSQENDSLCRL